jgi:hypothetical protein
VGYEVFYKHLRSEKYERMLNLVVESGCHMKQMEEQYENVQVTPYYIFKFEQPLNTHDQH